MERAGEDEEEVCCICHGSFQVPCQANCSHCFCGGCMLQLWDNGPALGPCKCPLCRRDIINLTFSIPNPTPTPTPHQVRILERIKRYNRVHGSTPLFQRVQELPFLAKRLLRHMMDPQRSLPFLIRTRVYLAMCGSFMHVVDIVPEAAMGTLGYVDDLMTLYMTFLHVVAKYRSLRPPSPPD